MARGTQHRKRRPTANADVTAQANAARPAKRPVRPAWEQQLFFGKIRRRGKWVMVLLAIVFLFSFVLLGVGSGSSGVSDILSNFFSGSSATGSSVSALQKKTKEHPKDAAAWLALANKLQADKKPDAAAAALTTYTNLKPKDSNALLQLAGIYLSRAQDWDTLYSEGQAQQAALAPPALVTPKSGTKLASAFDVVSSPLSTAASTASNSASGNEYSQVTTYLSEREGIYKKLVVLTPNDAITQYSLAQSATDASDPVTAIKGYKAFLKLAPDDSQAPTARAAIKQLQAQLQSTAAASATSTSGSTTATATTKSKPKSKTTAKKKSAAKKKP